MKALIVLLLLTASAHAQTVLVVRPDGTERAYGPLRPRVYVKHDTAIVRDTRIVRDTVTHDTVTREIYKIDTGRITLNITIEQPAGDTAREKPVRGTEFGVFGYADYQGAVLSPALSLDLTLIRFWLYAGARYQSSNHNIYFTFGVSGFAPF